MKESSTYGRKTWEPEFVGQGVGIKFTRITETNGEIIINGEITDGNGQCMGHAEVNERTGKSYVDIQRIGSMKRKTLVALYAKIHECLAFALSEEVAAENAQEAAEEEQTGEGPEAEEPG